MSLVVFHRCVEPKSSGLFNGDCLIKAQYTCFQGRMAYCDGGSFSRTSTGLMEPGSSIGPCWKSILNGLIRLARVSMDIMSLSSRNNFTALTKWAMLSNVGVEVGAGKCTSCRAMLSWQSYDASLWQRRWVRITLKGST